MRLCVDVHNHSCLSPCGSDALLPAVLVAEALDKGINMLGLTDHNTTRNLPAFAQVCEIAQITPLYGIEVTTIEEIHVLALFAELKPALHFGSYIEEHLPPVKNNPRLFGNQLVSDEQGNIIETVDLFLHGATDLGFDHLIDEILGLGALAIPAHIDRFANSVIANLGFLPPLDYSAVESVAYPPIVDTGSYTVIQSSDAHFIEHIGQRTFFIETETDGFTALHQALHEKKVQIIA
ncbi:MAG: PHP domain-containing protein [Sphaerochaetaceae bacterium]|jgi:PHP family Zn ribbon phosphoesterase